MRIEYNGYQEYRRFSSVNLCCLGNYIFGWRELPPCISIFLTRGVYSTLYNDEAIPTCDFSELLHCCSLAFSNLALDSTYQTDPQSKKIMTFTFVLGISQPWMNLHLFEFVLWNTFTLSKSVAIMFKLGTFFFSFCSWPCITS